MQTGTEIVQEKGKGKRKIIININPQKSPEEIHFWDFFIITT